jgi:ABC-type multidrug transport system fused ATPase/permease subunit
MKSFGGEFFEISNYATQIDMSYNKGALTARAYGVFVGSIMFLANTAILVVIYYGAILVIKSQMNVASLTSFVLYTIYIAMGLAEISSLFTEFMNALGASER